MATLYWRPLRGAGEKGPEPPWQSEVFGDEWSVLDTLSATLPTGDWLYRADLDPVTIRRTVKLGGGNRTLAEPDEIDRSVERTFLVDTQAAWVLLDGRLIEVPACPDHLVERRFPNYSPTEQNRGGGFYSPAERARYEMRQRGALRDVPSWPPYKDLPPVDWFHAYTMPAADANIVWIMAEHGLGRNDTSFFAAHEITARFIELQATRCDNKVIRDAMDCIALAAQTKRGTASQHDLERMRARMERHGGGKGRYYNENVHHGVVFAAAQCASWALGSRPWGWIPLLGKHMPRGEIHGLMPLPEKDYESVILCDWIREAAPFDAMARAMIERGEWK